MLIAERSFAALPTSNPAPLGFQAIYADVPGHSDGSATLAKRQLQQALPLVSVTTTQDTLQQSKNSVQNIRYFMQVAGLLALLIGGIGIINTMQVVLRRRHMEIAMLKTVGYQRHDLVNLFGLEASILGFIGGIVGAGRGYRSQLSGEGAHGKRPYAGSTREHSTSLRFFRGWPLGFSPRSSSVFCPLSRPAAFALWPCCVNSIRRSEGATPW